MGVDGNTIRMKSSSQSHRREMIYIRVLEEPEPGHRPLVETGVQKRRQSFTEDLIESEYAKGREGEGGRQIQVSRSEFESRLRQRHGERLGERQKEGTAN